MNTQVQVAVAVAVIVVMITMIFPIFTGQSISDSISQLQAAGYTIVSGDVNVEEEGEIRTTVVTGNATDDTVIVGTGINAAVWKALVNCVDAGGNHLNYTAATNTFSCGTTGGASGNTFETLNITTGTDPVADSSTDTLNILDSATVTVTGSAVDDSIRLSLVQHAGTNVLADLEEEGAINTTTVAGNASDDRVLLGSGVGTAGWNAVPDCTDGDGRHINYTAGSNSFSCGTTAGTGAAPRTDYYRLVGSSIGEVTFSNTGMQTKHTMVLSEAIQPGEGFRIEWLGWKDNGSSNALKMRAVIQGIDTFETIGTDLDQEESWFVSADGIAGILGGTGRYDRGLHCHSRRDNAYPNGGTTSPHCTAFLPLATTAITGVLIKAGFNTGTPTIGAICCVRVYALPTTP